jgi:periplasmic divalent cation tolerance protein
MESQRRSLTEALMSEFIQVFTTTGRKEEAESIAAALLEPRLAACVQIGGPITSRYWWQGQLEVAEEWFCFIKTTKSRYAEVEQRIKSVHPYETPEVIALPILDGSQDYLSWIAAIVRASRDPGS